MSARPPLQMTLSSVNNSIEDVQCGCVMHRMKGYKRKRRWGQLRMTTDNNQAKCIIQLFKHDLSQASPESSHKKEPKRKFELEFTRDNFCGIESGEHYDRYGTRRYLCIITREKHLIIEDAVMTATGINHNILGTWHQSILEAMVYVNRWKIIENDPKLASTKVCYLHVSAENISECHSLEDKTRDNRNCLVLRTWKTKDLDQVKEHESTTNGTTTTDIAFQVPTSFGGTSVVNMSVEGSPNFRHIVHSFKAEAIKPTTTVCPGFDDLKSGPNLIKVPQMPKEKKSFSSKLLGNGFGNRGNSSPEKSSKSDKLEGRNSHNLGNLYVQLSNGTNSDEHQYRNVPQPTPAPCVESDRPNPGACHNGRPGPSSLMVGSPAPCPHNSNPKVVVPPSLASQSPTRSITPEFICPPRNYARNQSPSPPRLPPSPLDDDLKKGPALATQTSFDSDYQTGDFTNFTSSDVPSSYVNLARGSSDPDFSRRNQPTTSGAIYQNLDDRPPAVPARDEDRNSYINLQHRHSLPPTDRPLVNVRSQQPPPRPPKDSPSKTLDRNGVSTLPPQMGLVNPPPPPIPGRRPTQEETDPLRKALVNDKLPPLPKEEEGKRAYENSAEFETTIDEVRRGTHWNGSRDRWLDLPYSVFVCIAVGLEKEESVVGDWKALAEVLGLTFHNIQQLAGIARASTTLRPVEVILLHWCRTQSPLPFTRWNLRMKLIAIGRADLAELVPLDDARRTSHDSG